MKPSLRPTYLFCILAVLAAAGCAPVTPHPGGEIGVLRVSGPNVFLNNAPASDGDPVRLGNSLTTGPGSSAMLEFNDGGYLQLDENTDPIFEWLEQSRCILVRIFKGQAYLKKERACVEGPNISMVLNSEVNLRIQPPPAPSEVTVLRGRAEVTLPAPLTLAPGQQMVTTTARRAPAVRTLSPEELRALVAWRTSYRFAPLRPRPEPPLLPFPRFPRQPDRSEPGKPDDVKPPRDTRPTPPPSAPGGPIRIPTRDRSLPVIQPPEPVIR